MCHWTELTLVASVWRTDCGEVRMARKPRVEAPGLQRGWTIAVTLLRELNEWESLFCFLVFRVQSKVV